MDFQFEVGYIFFVCVWQATLYLVTRALFIHVPSFIRMAPRLLGFSSSKPHFAIRCDYLKLFGNINFKCKASLKKLQPKSFLAANAQLFLPPCSLFLSGSQGWMVDAGCFHFHQANNPGKALWSMGGFGTRCVIKCLLRFMLQKRLTVLRVRLLFITKE